MTISIIFLGIVVIKAIWILAVNLNLGLSCSITISCMAVTNAVYHNAPIEFEFVLIAEGWNSTASKSSKTQDLKWSVYFSWDIKKISSVKSDT